MTILGGGEFRYETVWQRKNLVLITLPATDSDAATHYVSELSVRIPQFSALNTECVVTGERVPGCRHPGALVADKWSEIIYVHAASEVAGLPSAEELLDWIKYVEIQRPDREGEVK